MRCLVCVGHYDVAQRTAVEMNQQFCRFSFHLAANLAIEVLFQKYRNIVYIFTQSSHADSEYSTSLWQGRQRSQSTKSLRFSTGTDKNVLIHARMLLITGTHVNLFALRQICLKREGYDSMWSAHCVRNNCRQAQPIAANNIARRLSPPWQMYGATHTEGNLPAADYPRSELVCFQFLEMFTQILSMKFSFY